MPDPAPPLPDRPSIAVLPFQNLGGDPEQEYFADGVVEEIITALSRMRWLFVIARNSSFTYKGRAVDVKQVGRELGVRYVLEGSVRAAANRVRIMGHLIDATTGAHLWADSFEGGLEDIFALQDQVTASVVGAIAPELEKAEIDRARRKPTASLDAYDYFLRGMAEVHKWKREANAEALRLFGKAIELDPDFAAAWGMAARCLSQRKACGWATDHAADVAEVRRLARRAAELGADDAVALATAGIGLAYVAGDTGDGGALLKRALALNPNLAMAWYFSGWANVWYGEPELALAQLAHAMRLSPHDPQIAMMQAGTAWRISSPAGTPRRSPGPGRRSAPSPTAASAPASSRRVRRAMARSRRRKRQWSTSAASTLPCASRTSPSPSRSAAHGPGQVGRTACAAPACPSSRVAGFRGRSTSVATAGCDTNAG